MDGLSYQLLSKAYQGIKYQRSISSSLRAAGYTPGPAMQQAAHSALLERVSSAEYSRALARNTALSRILATSTASAAAATPITTTAAHLSGGDAASSPLAAISAVLLFLLLKIALPIFTCWFLYNVVHWRDWFHEILDQMRIPEGWTVTDFILGSILRVFDQIVWTAQVIVFIICWFIPDVRNWQDWFDVILDHMHLPADASPLDLALEAIKSVVVEMLRTVRMFVWILWQMFSLLVLAPLTIVTNLMSVARSCMTTTLQQSATRFQTLPEVEQLLFHYRGAVNWLGRNKWRIFFLCWTVWFLSLLIRKANEPRSVVVSWQEYQKYHEKPLPAMLLRARKESGSNSHFEGEDDEVFGLAVVDIPVTQASLDLPVVDMNVAEGTFSIGESWRYEPARKEKVVRYVGEQNVWCSHCRQWHCCELPY
ncbi:hypothetical protein BDY17DRAFT_191791 [Neohortaea acidophila]|uniref:Uncharacterized protein n=1 Tax=Neohortaea acidophila TaxID=245834 RepID=A0A6A6PJY9_9PEZI|nr:uncharacterized protein BDY17DRAFT_191791 [Neohortaea acidophila]KAF2480388.1 hypothetical protein BDY17DRAFT_191791 [Neohortaea acidophila]